MSSQFERLKVELSALSIDERAELASFLLHGLDADLDEEIDAAWEIEIKRRVEEIEAGTAKGTPADEVFDRLRLKAKSP